MSGPPVPPEGGTPTHRLHSNVVNARRYAVTLSFTVALKQVRLTERHWGLTPTGFVMVRPVRKDTLEHLILGTTFAFEASDCGPTILLCMRFSDFQDDILH